MSDTMTLEQSQPTAGLPPAGWYADPAADSLLRWWGGLAWTDHTRAVVAQPVSPPIATPAYGFKPLVSSYIPAGSSGHSGWVSDPGVVAAAGSGNTAPVWILAFYPLISWLIEFAIAALHLTTPIVIAFLVVIVVLQFVVAGADHSALTQRGLPAPSVSWLFLSLLGYLIRRRVVLKRAGIKSNAPGNVFALQFFLAMALVIVAIPIAASMGSAQRDVAAVHRLESQVSAELAHDTAVNWTVSCPTDAPASTTGASFACSATSGAGQTAVITATVVSPDRFAVKLSTAAANSPANT